jgi:predicted amidophosphoribosyltransferase
MVVLAAYADDVRSAVLAAKRPGGELLAAGLATLLARKHAGQIAAWEVDLIVPVPMHWTRRMLRGTSAADGLARGVAAALDLPRRTAVAVGRRVLVVDDVTTTGGTLSACRQALVAAGAAAVYAAAVARADAAEPASG